MNRKKRKLLRRDVGESSHDKPRSLGFEQCEARLALATTAAVAAADFTLLDIRVLDNPLSAYQSTLNPWNTQSSSFAAYLSEQSSGAPAVDPLLAEPWSFTITGIQSNGGVQRDFDGLGTVLTFSDFGGGDVILDWQPASVWGNQWSQDSGRSLPILPDVVEPGEIPIPEALAKWPGPFVDLAQRPGQLAKQQPAGPPRDSAPPRPSSQPLHTMQVRRVAFDLADDATPATQIHQSGERSANHSEAIAPVSDAKLRGTNNRANETPLPRRTQIAFAEYVATPDNGRAPTADAQVRSDAAAKQPQALPTRSKSLQPAAEPERPTTSADEDMARGESLPTPAIAEQRDAAFAEWDAGALPLAVAEPRQRSVMGWTALAAFAAGGWAFRLGSSQPESTHGYSAQRDRLHAPPPSQ